MHTRKHTAQYSNGSSTLRLERFGTILHTDATEDNRLPQAILINAPATCKWQVPTKIYGARNSAATTCNTMHRTRSTTKSSDPNNISTSCSQSSINYSTSRSPRSYTTAGSTNPTHTNAEANAVHDLDAGSDAAPGRIEEHSDTNDNPWSTRPAHSNSCCTTAHSRKKPAHRQTQRYQKPEIETLTFEEQRTSHSTCFAPNAEPPDHRAPPGRTTLVKARALPKARAQCQQTKTPALPKQEQMQSQSDSIIAGRRQELHSA